MLGLWVDSTLHQFRNAVQAGLILCQGYVPEKRCANWAQNSRLKRCISWGLGQLTASSYKVYDCTTSGHTCTIHTVCIHLCRGYIHFYAIYMFISIAVTMLRYSYSLWYSSFRWICGRLDEQTDPVSDLYSSIHPTRCNFTQFIHIWNCSTCFRWYLHLSSGTYTTG
jgi:hypothetical protein